MPQIRILLTWGLLVRYLLVCSATPLIFTEFRLVCHISLYFLAIHKYSKYFLYTSMLSKRPYKKTKGKKEDKKLAGESFNLCK